MARQVHISIGMERAKAASHNTFANNVWFYLTLSVLAAVLIYAMAILPLRG